MSLALPTSLMRTICALCCTILAVELCADENVCRTSDGKAFRGLLVGFSEQGHPVFDTNIGSNTVPLDELLYWGGLHDSPDGTQVLLADGSLIVAADVQLDGEMLLVRSRLFGEVEGFSINGLSRLPISAVRAIVFRAPLRPADRDQLLKRLQTVADAEDQLWLANGDVLKGTISRLARENQDDKPGPMTVVIKADAGDVEIRAEQPQGGLLEKVQAIAFNPALVRKVDQNSPALLVGLSDGTRLYAKQIDADGERATFTLVSGVKLTSHPDEDIWRKISSLQSFGPHVKYLSGLSPADYRHQPMLERKWPLGRDESVTGSRLRTAGRMFVKGLGMHSSARAVYVLDQPYARLEAELAIDESAGKEGSVLFLVAHDAGGKFKIAYKSPIIRGGDPPVPISLDVTGARRIALFVEEADHGKVLDRANWLDARLIPVVRE